MSDTRIRHEITVRTNGVALGDLVTLLLHTLSDMPKDATVTFDNDMLTAVWEVQ